MADHDFEFVKVGNSYAHVVQRRAVLWPLTATTRDDEAVKARTKELILRWRARLWSLQANGLELGGPVQTQSTRNCRPAFALATEQVMACKRRLICPSCYARRAAQLWERVDRAFPNEPRERTTEFPYRLVEAYLTNYLPYRAHEDEEDSVIVEQLCPILCQLVAGRRVRLKPQWKQPAGALTHATVEPTQRGWRFRARELYMVAAGSAYEERPRRNGWRVRCCEQPTRLEIVEAVARVMRYPRGLMYGDAGLTVKMLEARNRVGKHLTVCYGQFRGGEEER